MECCVWDDALGSLRVRGDVGMLVGVVSRTAHAMAGVLV